MANPRKDLPKWITGFDPAILAVILVGLGFLAIALAWNGAAGKGFVDQQFPYVISGGILGLGLIGLGAGLFLFESGRRNQAHLEAKLDELIEAVRGSSNGSAPASTAKQPSKAIIADGLFVVGRSSFHRPDCRLVEGKDDLDYAPLEEAQERGLTPCRVCDPVAMQTSGTRRKR